MPMRAAHCCLLLLLFTTASLAHAWPREQSGTINLEQRLQDEAGRNLPSRGMSMSQVRARYGAPLRRLQARGGQGPRQPVIHRWVYPGYIVYFERSRVIHSVATVSGGGSSAPSD